MSKYEPTECPLCGAEAEKIEGQFKFFRCGATYRLDIGKFVDGCVDATNTAMRKVRADQAARSAPADSEGVVSGVAEAGGQPTMPTA